MAENVPAVLATDEDSGEAVQLDAEVLKADLREFLRRWREGLLSPFSILESLHPFGGYRRYGEQTWHETLYGAWHPEFERQVTFGTGKGGRKIWGTNSFTADFVWREEKAIIELDGPSHSGAYRRFQDQRKDDFFWSLGFAVQRIKNSEIEQQAEDALMRWAEWRCETRSELDGDVSWLVRPIIKRFRDHLMQAEINAARERVLPLSKKPERLAAEQLQALWQTEHEVRQRWGEPDLFSLAPLDKAAEQPEPPPER